MAESNSKPTRCPCGFFGSAQTLGLCSKCYREREQNRDQLTADVTRSSNVSMEMRMDRETTSFQEDSCNNLTTRGGTEPDIHAKEKDLPRVTSSSLSSSSSSSSLAVVDTAVDSAGAESYNSHQRGRKRKLDERFEDETAGNPTADAETQHSEDDPDGQPPVQKNRKRCFMCNCRLDLARMEIGKCKCENVFCALHRLPEQHGCTFDHKEHCRQEARAKMVVLRKHVGTALKRLDSDS